MYDTDFGLKLRRIATSLSDFAAFRVASRGMYYGKEKMDSPVLLRGRQEGPDCEEWMHRESIDSHICFKCHEAWHKIYR